MEELSLEDQNRINAVVQRFGGLALTCPDKTGQAAIAAQGINPVQSLEEFAQTERGAQIVNGLGILLESGMDTGMAIDIGLARSAQKQDEQYMAVDGSAIDLSQPEPAGETAGVKKNLTSQPAPVR